MVLDIIIGAVVGGCALGATQMGVARLIGHFERKSYHKALERAWHAEAERQSSIAANDNVLPMEQLN